MDEKIIQYVAAAAKGDADAMAKLYSKTLKASYFLAAVLCADAEEAADITGKAYARAFLNVDKLKRPEAFELWMKQNVAAVYKEGRKFIFNDADAGARDAASEFLPESVVEDDEKREAIMRAVSGLKKELRAAITLRYNNGMPTTVLAKFFGVSESTANALLSKARTETLRLSGLSAPEKTGAAEKPPVLTRIFQRESSEIAIEDKTVRDAFIYAVDEYNKANPVPAGTLSEDGPEEEARAQEGSGKTEPSGREAFESEPYPKSGSADALKRKIEEILTGAADAAEPGPRETEKSADRFSAEERDGETAGDERPDEPYEAVLGELGGGASEDGARDEIPAEKKAAVKKNAAKLKIDKKTAGIVIAAVLAAIFVLVGIIRLAGGNGPGKRSDSSDAEWNAESGWRPGGFEECLEIEYLDENCCRFKSAATGKYGLLDYSGNVVLQPNYDEFKRCGNGRDYSNRNSYHSLVKIGNDYYEFSVSGGSAVISPNPHVSHSVEGDVLGKKVSYEERDRYFEGYAAARKKGKWGYVSLDKDKKVVPYEYDAVNDLQSYEAASCDYCRGVTGGLIAVKKDGKMGIINLKNKTVVPFEFDDIMPGVDGAFMARKNGTWGFILTGDAAKNFKGVKIKIYPTPPEPVSGGAENAEPDKYVVSSLDGANVRSDAGAEHKQIGELDYGDKVSAYSEKKARNGKTWVCIKYDGEFGWVAASNLKKLSGRAFP